MSRPQVDECLFSLTVFLLFLLVTHQGYVGMSMENDGLIYASIAKHLALGEGSFWFPYSPFNESAFHHHPPLSFWFQSLFFRLFGDHFWVENTYQFFCLSIVLICLQISWRLSTDQSIGGWRTWLLFLCAPIVSFVFTDNFLEAPLAMFISLAVVFLQLAFRQGSFLFLVVASVMTVAAFLVKGPVGLLPLGVAPILGWMHGSKQWLAFTVGQSILFTLFIGVLMLEPKALESMTNYVKFQWVGTAQGQRPELHGRGYLLIELARNLISLALVGALLAWKLKLRPSRAALGWLLIALLASLPLLISPRQFKWYLAPAMPFYALAIASYLGPTVELGRRGKRILYTLPVLLSVGLAYVSVTRFSSLDNDHAAIHDLRLVQNAVPVGSAVGFCGGRELSRYFLYLSRYHSIKITNSQDQEFVFCAEELDGFDPVLGEFKVVPLLKAP